ncbi:MAG: ATP-binding cassette domain-containing protein [Bacilli bacterium]|nr:ATP-binding cassette domain-containing protein [Bacilli bacterium]
MEIVKQDGNMDCGVCCLLSIIRYYGGNIPIEYLREKTNTTKSGVNAYKLVEAACDLGFDAYGLNGKLEDIKDEYLPLIAHVIINKNLKHFIVIYQIDRIKRQLIVMDPDKGKIKMSFSQFNLITSYNFIYLKNQGVLPNIGVKKTVKNWIKLFSLNNKGYLVYIIILSIVSFCLNILCSFHFTLLLNNGINIGMKNNIYIITNIFILIYFLKILNTFLREKTSMTFNILLDEYITKKYYHKLILLPYIYYKNRTTGEIMSRMEDLNTIKSFLTNLLVTFTADVLVVLVFIVVLFNKNIILFIITVFLSFILFVIQLVSNRVIKTRLEKYKSKLDKVNTVFIEALEKQSTIKNLHLERKIISKFYRIYECCLNSLYSVMTTNLITNLLKEIIHDSFYILFFLLLSLRVIDNKINLGIIIVLESIVRYYFGSFNRILSLYSDYYKYRISKSRIENLFMIKEENFNCSNYFKEIKLNGVVEYRDLTYGFNSNNIFNNLSFIIKPKEKIFFYGDSGSGKSTMMKMLMRYIEVPFGCIKINGIDINHHHLDILRNEISYVSQNEHLFKDTIKNNITLDRNISFDDLEKVCEITNAKEIIDKKDAKLNTLVDDEGLSLSGGERQKIILARTLLNNSNIFIFDEALSQIDEKQERKILTDMFRYLKDKTVIIISHRMINKDLYTRVVKLKEGKVYDEV